MGTNGGISQFSTKVVRDFSSEIFKTNAVKLIGIIYEDVTRDESIEIQDLFMTTTLDSIVNTLFGIDLGTMCGTNNEESIQFSNAFDDANEATVYRIFDILWKIKWFLNIEREAVLRSTMKVVDQFIYKLIKRKTETDPGIPILIVLGKSHGLKPTEDSVLEPSHD